MGLQLWADVFQISQQRQALFVACHNLTDLSNQNCYLEFDFLEDKNFTDLLFVFEKVKAAKNNEQPQPDAFWLNSFPNYSLRQFYFSNTDLKPDFETAQQNEFSWHFYSLVDLLQKNYDVEYKECIKLDSNKGRLEYYPWAYPYGGITGLITFIKSFECRPTIIDDGTGIYSIELFENGDFKTTDLKNKDTTIEKNEDNLLTKLLKSLRG